MACGGKTFTRIPNLEKKNFYLQFFYVITASIDVKRQTENSGLRLDPGSLVALHRTAFYRVLASGCGAKLCLCVKYMI